jgi:hypothetical protein
MSLELWATVTIECAHTMPDRFGVPELHGHSYWIQCFVASTSSDPIPLPTLQKEAQRVAGWVRAKVMTRQELVGIARAALGVRGIAGAAAVAPPAGLYWQAPARQDAEA